jgi:hypothetical protein
MLNYLFFRFIIIFVKDQTSENNDEMDEEELARLRTCITAMQETLATTNDPDSSLISDYFKETFEIRRTFVKTHNTNEILAEYPALQLHSCVCLIDKIVDSENENFLFCSYLLIFICKQIFLFKQF